MKSIFSKIHSVIFGKSKGNKDTDTGEESNYLDSDPLEVIFNKLQKDIPIKKYILKDDIANYLSTQSEILYSSLQHSEDYSKYFYSYISFHQIYFHLKNFLLLKKKKLYGYRYEFIEIFQDIFLDNFVIFKHIYEIFDEEDRNKYSSYFNIWLDGFFVNLSRKIINSSTNRYRKVQPDLFFAVLLFIALPEISSEFNEIEFTNIIKFTDATNADFKNAVNQIKKYDIYNPLSQKSINAVVTFLGLFLDLDVSVTREGDLCFDEFNTLKCVELINTLIIKTDEIMNNIKNIRPNILI